jgi:hypothetical protein
VLLGDIWCSDINKVPFSNQLIPVS